MLKRRPAPRGDMIRLSSSVCHVHFGHFKLGGVVGCGYTSWRVLCSILSVVRRAFTHSSHFKYPFLSWEASFRFPLRNTHAHRKRAIDKSDKAIFHFPILSIVRVVCQKCTFNFSSQG